MVHTVLYTNCIWFVYLVANCMVVLFLPFRHAAQCAVNLMTFEDEQELVKMHKLFPGARWVKNLACAALK